MAGGGVTLGQSGGGAATGPLRGCVDKRTGELFLVRAGRSCRSGRRVVTWNVRGRAGPAGAAGLPGAGGAQGARGPDGAPGAPGSFSFNQFDGMPCDAGSGPDSVALTYDPNGFARFEC